LSSDKGTVTPLIVTTDSKGTAKATLSTIETTTVTAVIGPITATVTVPIAPAGSSNLVTLTPSQPHVSDATDPVTPCTSPSLNSQLPLSIYGFVTDLQGKLVNGVKVQLAVEDLPGGNDATGGFCLSPASTPDNIAVVDVVSGSNGTGGFVVSYSFTGADLAACAALTGGLHCTAVILATSAQAPDAQTTIQIQ